MQQKLDQVNFIFLLGDNYGHHYFRNKNENELAEWNKYFYNKIREIFKDKVVIPVLGNHESHPVNYYDYTTKKNFVNENIITHFKNFLTTD